MILRGEEVPRARLIEALELDSSLEITSAWRVSLEEVEEEGKEKDEKEEEEEEEEEAAAEEEEEEEEEEDRKNNRGKGAYKAREPLMDSDDGFFKIFGESFDHLLLQDLHT
ncbi:hypothetical protein V1477_012391 [Vespula maculifrons]|uniref:Uncharacterized protein n=1 Tax=Vespula maculifrons TaxID=7453 RepID=A0ABD2BXD9_VESMC